MLKLPATFDGFSSRSDGSFGVRFSTQEMGGEGMKMLADHVRRFGWLLFAEESEGVDSTDIPEEKVERDDISPSKRLYNVLFVLWNQLTEKKKTDEPFNVWRERQMEKMINALKNKIT